MKMILFDIDGTLLLTGGVGQIAFDLAFEEIFGVPEAWQDTIPDGKTDPLIIDEIAKKALGRPLSGAEYVRLCRSYHDHFRERIKDAHRFRLMPGVLSLLETCRAERHGFMGVATGNFEEAAWSKLKRGGIADFFRFGGFADSFQGHEQATSDGDMALKVLEARCALTREAMRRGREMAGHALAEDRIFLIGDTLHDVRAGKKLGLRTIAVATGGVSPEKLEQAKPDLVLEDLSDTDRFFKFINA